MECFYDRKSGRGNKYNFSLEDLINNFSFYDLCSNGEIGDYGAFLVITNKQYIIGYNAGFGDGTHAPSFARVLKDLKGGGMISSYLEVESLEREITSKYLTGRIIYNVMPVNEMKTKKDMYGYIHFDLTKKQKISSNEWEMFKKFYEDYNDEIKLVAQKFNFFVCFHYYGDNYKVLEDNCNSLDNLYKYLEKNIYILNDVPEERILNGSKKCR